MMSQIQERCVFLITGIMAAGKSTIAQLLTETFDKGVHVRGDMFRKMIVAGRDELLPHASKEALSQLSLRYRIAASVTDTYFEAGFNVVVQDVIVGSHLKEFVGLIRSRPLFVVVLSPSIETVTARESTRSKKGYGAWTVSELQHILHNETPRIGLWLDTSEQKPEDTVDEILQRAWTEALV